MIHYIATRIQNDSLDGAYLFDTLEEALEKAESIARRTLGREVYENERYSLEEIGEFKADTYTFSVYGIY